MPGGFVTVSAENIGVLIDADEVHSYEIAVAPSERATAIVTPASDQATLTAQFVGHGNPSIASRTW